MKEFLVGEYQRLNIYYNDTECCTLEVYSINKDENKITIFCDGTMPGDICKFPFFLNFAKSVLGTNPYFTLTFLEIVDDKVRICLKEEDGHIDNVEIFSFNNV